MSNHLQLELDDSIAAISDLTGLAAFLEELKKNIELVLDGRTPRIGHWKGVNIYLATDENYCGRPIKPVDQSEECHHYKIAYDNLLYLGNPPQHKWICRKCGKIWMETAEQSND